MKCLGDIFIPWFLDDAQGFYFRLGWTTQWWDVVDLFISLFFSFPFTRFWYIFFNFYIRTTMIPWNLDSRILFPFGLNQRCWLCGSFHFLKDFSFSFDKITIHLIWNGFLQLYLLCKNDLILIIWFLFVWFIPYFHLLVFGILDTLVLWFFSLVFFPFCPSCLAKFIKDYAIFL